MAVEETADALKALRDDGVTVDRIVVNRLTQPPPQRCALVQRPAARRAAGARAGSSRTGLPRSVARSAPRDGRRAARSAGARADRPAARRTSAGAAVTCAAGVHSSRDPRGGRRCRSPDEGGAPQLAAGTHEAGDVRRQGRRRQDDVRRGRGRQIASERRRPRVLLLSTDPAHSLGDVFGDRLSDTARPIKGGPVEPSRPRDRRPPRLRRAPRALCRGDRRARRPARPEARASAAQRPCTTGRCCRI